MGTRNPFSFITTFLSRGSFGHQLFKGSRNPNTQPCGVCQCGRRWRRSMRTRNPARQISSRRRRTSMPRLVHNLFLKSWYTLHLF